VGFRLRGGSFVLCDRKKVGLKHDKWVLDLEVGLLFYVIERKWVLNMISGF